MASELTAENFIIRLQALQSDDELRKIQRYFKSGEGEYGEGDQFMGVRMGNLFALAKEFVAMTPDQIDILLQNPIHEVRVGGLSIMDKQARIKKTTAARRQELYELYMRRHDRINNWDLVDICAPHVVGGYLWDKPRDILYDLARSENLWHRRTAIVSTNFFIVREDLDDTFNIAEILVNDPEDLIHKAVGGGLRWAGSKDQQRLIAFLDKHAATMPRVMLRYAIEHFDKPQREHYMGVKNLLMP